MSRPASPTPRPIAGALAKAEHAHRHDRLDAAEAHYRRVLATDPGQARAWHGLGLLLAQRGGTGEAIDALERAVRAHPHEATYTTHLGNVLRAAGRRDEAAAAYRGALRIRPDHAPARFNLASLALDSGDAGLAAEHFAWLCARDAGDRDASIGLAIALLRLGRASEAERRLDEHTRIHAGDAEAWTWRGDALRALGRPEEAASAARRALALAPASAPGHHALGLALRALGDAGGAESALREAIRHAPDHVAAHVNLADLLIERGEHEGAAAACRAALAVRPDHPGAWANLAESLAARARLHEAIECYRRALERAPHEARLWHGLGAVLVCAARAVEAEHACRRALGIDPDSPAARSVLGDALRAQERLEEAAAEYDAVAAPAPDHPRARNHLGLVRLGQGRVEEAIAAFEQALDSDPEYAEAHSNLLLAGHYRSGEPPEATAARHRRWARRHAAHLAPTEDPFPPADDPDRRLRIGYVSPDLRGHPVGFFVEAVVEAHDREAVEVWCYSDVETPDGHTAWLRARCDGWRDVRGLDDAALCALVRADGVDVLVDLAGHTAHNRLRAFARRAAPLQATWIGYPDTTGLAEMDLRLVDAWTDPEGDADRCASERLVRLPGGFLCYRPPDVAPAVASRAPGASPVLGSCNNLAKLGDETVAAWSEILRRAPETRLLLKSPALADEGARRHATRRFAAHGVDAGRLELHGDLVSKAEHLRVYERIDVALDPFPYNGTTTTCEALWMGVPVVALAGDRHCARVGASLLSRVGLAETIATNAADYVRIALDLVHDADRRARLRSELRARMARSPLLDATGTTRALEHALREAWRARRAGAGPVRALPGRPSARPHSPRATIGRSRVRVLHQLARSGGTLVARCLGCMRGVALLSEIHPHGAGYFEPLEQAWAWHGLVDREEVWSAQARADLDLAESLALIARRCEERGLALLVRDWTHLDYVPVAFVRAPALRPAIVEVLAGRFDVVRAATVRHPLDQWLSLKDLRLTRRAGVDLETFLAGYRRFAEESVRVGFTRYEDLVRDPATHVRILCERLDLAHDPGFLERWADYTKVTGDRIGSGARREIRPAPRPPLEAALLERVERLEDYRASIEMLGYTHP